MDFEERMYIAAQASVERSKRGPTEKIRLCAKFCEGAKWAFAEIKKDSEEAEQKLRSSKRQMTCSHLVIQEGACILCGWSNNDEG